MRRTIRRLFPAVLTGMLAATPAASLALELEDPAALGFGRPGFTSDTTWSATQDYSDAAGSVDLLETKVLLPLLKIGEGETVAGFSLSWRGTFMDAAGVTDGSEDLHELDLQFAAVHEPKGSPWRYVGLIRGGVGTDFEALDSDDLQGMALLLAAREFSPTFSMAGGVFAMADMREGMVLPALGCVWTPDDVWMLQITPPFIVAGCRINAAWMASLSLYPSGGRWDLDDRADGADYLSLSQWRAAAGLKYSATEHLSIAVRAGINFAGELELQDRDERVMLGTDLDPAPFVAVTAKWVF